MNKAHGVTLEFDTDLNDLAKGKALRDGLSVALQIGATLWVANDETVSLERLTPLPDDGAGACRYGQHKQFQLGDYLALPVPPSDDPEELDEADIEGLAFDAGYLWLVGSHSLKRKKPKLKEGYGKASKQLAKIGRDGNRYLLARIPILEEAGGCRLEERITRHGKDLYAARLGGNAFGDELTEALQDDEHLGPFLAIPGKDNGFDIEGLAVVDGRIFLGLRGPVLRGWAVVLELAVDDDPGSSTLSLKAIGPNKRRYRKHFLQLGGLGIRDLCVQGADLLILAGPTLDLDGPVNVFRWPGGCAPDDEVMVPSSVLQPVLDVPFGEGNDHAEGITLYVPETGQKPSLLVVYDAVAECRKVELSAVLADIFQLP